MEILYIVVMYIIHYKPRVSERFISLLLKAEFGKTKHVPNIYDYAYMQWQLIYYWDKNYNMNLNLLYV
jgi:hypothetical protein